MKRERGILISVVTAALVMVFLCFFFTSDRAVSVKTLKKCVPDAVHFEEDGREQYDFLMEAYGEAPGSIVFYTAHQSVAVYADGEELYTLETSDSIWGDTPGWRWCFVELQDGVSGSVYSLRHATRWQHARSRSSISVAGMIYIWDCSSSRCRRSS